jgi:spore maturation protein CgeB
MISDRWPGIDHFFTPGREIRPPESTDEVIEILRTTHDDDRRMIGLAARERILAEHTAEHRAEELEALVALPASV